MKQMNGVRRTRGAGTGHIRKGNNMSLKFFDLFAGIGGFRLGMEKA